MTTGYKNYIVEMPYTILFEGDKNLCENICLEKRMYKTLTHNSYVFWKELLFMPAIPKLIVDEQKCIRCGICQSVCPTQAIHVDKHSFSFNPPFCIACGHCVAVCPHAALDNDACPAESMLPCRPVLDEETAEYFLRSRRSIRCFKNTKIARSRMAFRPFP